MSIIQSLKKMVLLDHLSMLKTGVKTAVWAASQGAFRIGKNAGDSYIFNKPSRIFLDDFYQSMSVPYPV
jgi:hypothetical protein